MFTKGQQVTYLQSWDSKGTVSIGEYVVYSCGAKQMILVDERGTKFGKHNFRPSGECGYGYIVPRLSPEAAEAAALELGASIVVQERARLESRIRQWPESKGFVEAIQKNIAALHEPRFIWKGRA